RIGPPEWQPEAAADAIEVAPHVAALGRIEVERRIVPALRPQERSEQERPPAHRHARGLGERADPHGGRIRIGRGELEEEVENGTVHRTLPWRMSLSANRCPIRRDMRWRKRSRPWERGQAGATQRAGNPACPRGVSSVGYRSPECVAMESRKLALPLLAFAGGAILGRLFGLKALMRGAMTAAAFTGITSQPA